MVVGWEVGSVVGGMVAASAMLVGGTGVGAGAGNWQAERAIKKTAVIDANAQPVKTFRYCFLDSLLMPERFILIIR